MGKQQRMLGIDTLFSNFDKSYFHQDSFASYTSFFDYDAVIINTHNIIRHYTTDNNNTYENKICLSRKNTIRVCDDYYRMNQKLIDYLQTGKTIFLLMGHNEKCYITKKIRNYLGQTEYVPHEFNMFSFLPVAIEETCSYGREMQFYCNSPYKEFFEEITKFTRYTVYYTTQEPEMPLAKIKDSNKTVASVIEFNGGKIICLPQPNFDTCNAAQDYWKDYTIPFLDSLFELNARLQPQEAEALPAWTNNILILNEAEHLNAKKQIMDNLAELQRKLNEEEEIIDHIQKYKQLLTASGTALEEITKQVLCELGFTLFDTEKGQADIIAKYNEYDIVAEIKGVKKSAAQVQATQLEKWAAQFLEDNNREAKPILIVNGFRETPLQERTEDVFPDQMVPYSKLRNHVLVSTTQLLCLYIETKNDSNCKEERITELLNMVGVYERYKNIYDYIKLADETGESDG